MSDTPKINLKINQGATFRYKFLWRDVRGWPVNLTGYTARMQIRATVASTAILATLTTENGGIALDAMNGTVSLYISDAATSGFAWASGVYDIELIAPVSQQSDVTRLVSGNVTVTPEVTR